MAKVRVYEVAEEFGVDSRQLLATLKSHGEFVRSTSSTIEPPVVRKLRNRYAHGTFIPSRTARRESTTSQPERNPFINATANWRERGQPATRRSDAVARSTTSTSVTQERPPSRKDNVLAEAASIFNVWERTLRLRRSTDRRPAELRKSSLSLEDLEWLPLQVLLRYSKLEPFQFRQGSRPTGGRPSRGQALPRVHRLTDRLDEVVVEQVASDYQAGQTTYQIAERLGVAPTSVGLLLRGQGVALRLQRITPAEAAEAIRASAVRMVLARAGVPRRDKRAR